MTACGRAVRLYADRIGIRAARGPHGLARPGGELVAFLGRGPFRGDS